MKLSTAVQRINETREELHDRDGEVDELVELAVRRLVSEPFEVLAKGLNPSRFDSWSKGARSKVARRFGSSSDLMMEVLHRAITPDRGNLAGAIAIAGEVIAGGESYEGTARAFGRTFYENLCEDDGFRIQILAWIAAPDRAMLSEELRSLYASLEERVVVGIEAILEASGRQLRPGLTVQDQAAMLLAVTEGSVLQGLVRGNEETSRRFGDYVAFLLEHGSEPIV